MDRDILTDLATGKEFPLKPLGEVRPHCLGMLAAETSRWYKAKRPAKPQAITGLPWPGRRCCQDSVCIHYGKFALIKVCSSQGESGEAPDRVLQKLLLSDAHLSRLILDPAWANTAGWAGGRRGGPV